MRNVLLKSVVLIALTVLPASVSADVPGPLIKSTYFGGSYWDENFSIAVDSQGYLYIAGSLTTSDSAYNFTPGHVVNSSYVPNPSCTQLCLYADVFVTRVSPDFTDVKTYFLGGSGWESVGKKGLVIDENSDGNVYIYVTGFTNSTDFEGMNAYDTTPNGMRDAFVTKLVSNTNSGVLDIVAGTYLGGASDDAGSGLDSNTSITFSNGSIYVAITTASSDLFPAEKVINAFQPYYSSYNSSICETAVGAEIGIAKFNTDLQLVSGTYLGGSCREKLSSITVSDGYVYVAGETFSPNFPTTDGAYRQCSGYNGTTCGTDNGTPSSDAFIAKINTDLTGAGYAGTYIGGTRRDRLDDVVVRGDTAYAVGLTNSDNATFRPQLAGRNKGGWDRYSYYQAGSAYSDIFVVKMNTALTTPSSVPSGTFMGTTAWESPWGSSIVAAANGDVYIGGKSGYNGSDPSGAFPTTACAYRRTNTTGYGDGVITQFDANLGIKNSTLVPNSYVHGIALHGGELYATGSAYGPEIPISQGAYFQEHWAGGDGYQVFVARFRLNLSYDYDNDGVCDGSDNCPAVPNGTVLGTCYVGGNTCTSSNDCPKDLFFWNFCEIGASSQNDQDGDGLGDVCDACRLDDDRDGYGNPGIPVGNEGCLGEDNCPSVCNTQQLDADADGIGDMCDTTPGCGGCGQAECEEVCSL
jgi:hypothetical protein